MENKTKISLIIGIIIAVVLSSIAITLSYISFTERSKQQEVIVKTEPPEYKVFIPKIPDSMNFCGEQVPVHDIDVRERIERELLVNSHWYSATILIIKRAHRWFPVIEKILKENSVPDDFKFMAVIESGLTNVTSPAGAVGFWQFMEPAAKKYNLEINSEVDERYNVEKSTEAACRYLKDSYMKYKNWTVAAASYNYGLNGVDRQIDRQKTSDYYKLFLNQETYRFVARIVAMKEILTDPKKYGFDIPENELYPVIEYEKKEINSGIKDLAEFAAKNNINYKMLKLMNPWLRQNQLTNKSRKQYVLKIPNEDSFLYEIE